MADERLFRRLIILVIFILACGPTPAAHAQGLFAPAATGLMPGSSIPPAGIPVLENALGDIVRDSVVDVLDLLRLRDITIGSGPAPTGYELAEADLTADGGVDGADLELLGDILLRISGVPYLIDSMGGSVTGDGITLSIPPGAVDSTMILSVRRTSESEFASGFGVDTKSGALDSAFFMSSFEITSSTLDFSLPVGMSIKLDSIPPCAYQGLNGLFTAVPDRDGDGRSELTLINELLVGGDSLTVTAKDIVPPSIHSLSLTEVEPGQSLIINGSGFGSNIQSLGLVFRHTGTDSATFVFPSYADDSTVVLTVPALPAGEYHLTAQNLLAGISGDPRTITILSYSQPVTDIRATIINFYMHHAAVLDSASNDSLHGVIEDTTVRRALTGMAQTYRASVDSTIEFFVNLEDSLLGNFASLASYIDNMAAGSTVGAVANHLQPYEYLICPVCKPYEKMKAEYVRVLNTAIEQYHIWAADCIGSRLIGNCEPCLAAESWRTHVLDLTDLIAAYMEMEDNCRCRNCPVEPGLANCDGCPDAIAVGWGPQAKKVQAGYGPGGFKTQGLCLNIIKYKRNQCVPTLVRWLDTSPVPLEPSPYLKCPASLQVSGEVASMSSVVARAHPGSIVKITNAPVPYNIVGILNDDGKAFIPHVPINTKVTFSIYDPVSGLYDPDAGTYTTGSVPGGFDRPMLLFRPPTGKRTFTLDVGSVMHDSVSLDWQRIDYRLHIGGADTSKLFNIGFSATNRLALRIQDPDGKAIFDNADLACYASAHLRFSTAGDYLIRVSYGVGGQAGSFDLGVSVSPVPPLPSSCLCGEITADTLFEELAPYDVTCAAAVPASDTVSIEPDVTIRFEPGGTLTSSGVLVGTGTDLTPIRLRMFDPESPQRSEPTTQILKPGPSIGKEEKP